MLARVAVVSWSGEVDSHVVPREADLYACLHRGNPGDTDFYARCCEGAGSILELGSGYGRVSFALGALAHSVTGVELDPGLLALSRADLRARTDLRGRVRFVAGDMRSFQLYQTFDRVIIPYSGLYCLLSDEEVSACLTHVKKHLKPGGTLCLDGYYADTFHSESVPEDGAADLLEPIVSLVHEGEVLSVYERSEWDPRAQRIDVFYEYRTAAASVYHTAVVKQRYLLLSQLRESLHRAGFAHVETFADFGDSAPGPDTETVAVIARRRHPHRAPNTSSAYG